MSSSIDWSVSKISTASSRSGVAVLVEMGGRSRCDMSKMLVNSGGGNGIMEPRDEATVSGDPGGDDVLCAGKNKSCARARCRTREPDGESAAWGFASFTRRLSGRGDSVCSLVADPSGVMTL